MRPNNSFKPNLLRYTNNMAGKACHVVGCATQVGLTQALAAMDTLRRKLMLDESTSRSLSADTLRKAGDNSDSGYLLRLLAFELVLKVLVEEHTAKAAPKHHKYAEIFELLPASVRSELLGLAGECIGHSALNSGWAGVLEELGSNFVQLRYPYDKYTGLSQEQYAKLGPSWISAGAKNEEATFRYYPEELRGLTEAARRLAGC